MLKGRYKLWFPGEDPEVDEPRVVENMITQVGAQSFLKMIAQGNTSDVSDGGDYYLGMCTPGAATDTLASLVDEPTSTGGYARLAITRDGTGFPVVGLVNGVYRAQSKVVTWTATGANFSEPITGLFLCNASSGSTGILFSYSGALANAPTIAEGTSYSVQYELYLQ